MIEGILPLLLSAFPLMGSPGPATLSLAALGATSGFRSSRTYLLGIIAGTIGVLLIVAVGLTGFIAARPALAAVLSLFAISYIIYLAVKIALAPVGQMNSQASHSPGFFPGLLLALANPKAFAAIGAVYTGNSVIEGQPLNDAIAKTLILSGVVVVVNLSWLLFGTALSKLMSHEVYGRVINLSFAAALIIAVIAMTL